MKSQEVAIVIPIYKTKMSKLENFSFRNNLDILRNRDVILLAPEKLEDHVIKLSKSINSSYLLVDNKYFGSVHATSRLMISIDFYKEFEKYDYILTCQLDVVVFKDTLDYWMNLNFDYIGAPIFHNDEKGFENIREGFNGGLCLRKVASCIEVLKDISFYYSDWRTLLKMEKYFQWKIYRIFRDGFVFNYSWEPLKPVINEDMFWSVIVPKKYSWYRIPVFNDARKFAFEANPKWMLELNNNEYPMGVHAWWKFDKMFVVNMIVNQNGIVIEELESKLNPNN